jgi:hypothetical protein
MKSRVAKLAAAAVVGLALAAGSTFAKTGDKDIVDTAVSAGQFKTLATAISAAASPMDGTYQPAFPG